METLKNPLIITVTGGLLLFIPAAQGYIFGVPQPYAPFPLPFTFAILAFGFGATIIPSILFFVFCHRLFTGNPKTSIYIFGIAIILGILSIVWFILSWDYGTHYQGFSHTLTVLILNCVVYLSSLFLLIWGKDRPSFPVAFTGQWLLFAWLTWVAFPWLGELI